MDNIKIARKKVRDEIEGLGLIGLAKRALYEMECADEEIYFQVQNSDCAENIFIEGEFFIAEIVIKTLIEKLKAKRDQCAACSLRSESVQKAKLV